MTRFQGKTAIVTGGASGIGAAVGLRLADEGANVVLLDIVAENLERVAGQAVDRGHEVATVVADVTDDGAVEAAVAEAVRRFGGLDLAFNIAGGARLGALTDISVEDWTFTLDLVLKGTFLVTRHVARAMRAEGRGGAIVNVSSLNAHVPLYGGSSYAAGKAGVENFTKNSALELGAHGIRVNAVLPGLVDTPLTADFLATEPLLNDFTARIALHRPATPEEIAGPVLYLASDDASYVTGTSLVVDGGWEITNYPDLSPYV